MEGESSPVPIPAGGCSLLNAVFVRAGEPHASFVVAASKKNRLMKDVSAFVCACR